eukprot:629793-Hanusia_phi.AAC.1
MLEDLAQQVDRRKREISEMDAREMYEELQGRIGKMQKHMDSKISNIEKMFVTTVAPLVETLDILVRQQTENAALEHVRKTME